MENTWRALSAQEIEQLEKQLNSADDWNLVSVVDAFKVDCVHRTHFGGNVFIGADVRIANVGLLAGYRLEEGCRLQNVGELSFTGYRFDFPVEVCNEDGSHTITACPDMTTTDACLAASVAADHPLRFMRASAAAYAAMTLGVVGRGTQIRNVQAVRDCYVGENAVLSECTLVENVFVHSSADEPTHLGAGVIVRNVVLGLQNVVDTHAIVRNVVTGSHVSLTDGLRISHTVVGDNSHLACCEVLHALIYPFHEQHHNNSFLIAAKLQGQTNVAAGATLGSNHNGRMNDCDLVAGRGFWPGLCVSVKFPSRFASYTLMAKGDYPYEINLKLPFCLLNNNVHDNVLEIMPAFWWMYNAFALRRNAQKFVQRDHRKVVSQYIQTSPLAPDTVQEIMDALNRMRLEDEALTKGVERSKRAVRILKKTEAEAAYREMLLYYVMNTLKEAYDRDPLHLLQMVKQAERKAWANVGGQLMLQTEVDKMLQQPSSDWKAMHERYREQWERYEQDNLQNACFVLKYLCDAKPDLEKLQMLFKEGVDVVARFEARADAERARDLAAITNM
ncbi:MAG: DUF4954 family protein [Bacteroidales bacterium]|nr:DUF4954 family protein [Bacteroidales bacterium]